MITAKHGQSPIDPSRYVSQTINGTSPVTLLSNAGYIPFSESTNNPTGIGPTEDDVSLLWLKSSSDTLAAVQILEDNASTTGIALGQIYYGPSLSLNYNDPTVDPRTPDIIVTPNVGVTYTGSTRKQAEHGGFAHDDTNVVLLLSNSTFKPNTVRTRKSAPLRSRRPSSRPWVSIQTHWMPFVQKAQACFQPLRSSGWKNSLHVQRTLLRERPLLLWTRPPISILVREAFGKRSSARKMPFI